MVSTRLAFYRARSFGFKRVRRNYSELQNKEMNKRIGFDIHFGLSVALVGICLFEGGLITGFHISYSQYILSGPNFLDSVYFHSAFLGAIPGLLSLVGFRKMYGSVVAVASLVLGIYQYRYIFTIHQVLADSDSDAVGSLFALTFPMDIVGIVLFGTLLFLLLYRIGKLIRD